MNGVYPHSFYFKNVKVMKKILLVFIVFTILIPTSNASVLIDAFRHESNVCTEGCHQRFPAGGDDVCGNCHSYGLNVPVLESQHNPNICKGCHSITDKNNFHMVHKEVSCDTKCHTVQNTKVSTPKNSFTKCESCHTMKIHTLHENKVSELCSTCHGSAVSSNTNPISASTMGSTTYFAANYQKFTLYEMFKRLITELEGE